jgi:predicted amidohydrolase YtcJ
MTASGPRDSRRLNYNMELRWDGVPSLADGLGMLNEQAQRTPPGQWVRVVGGWSEFQFAERRMPTLEEVNALAPETPVFLLQLYCRALLNKAALRACGYTKDTPDPPGGEIQRDRAGNPTGDDLFEFLLQRNGQVTQRGRSGSSRPRFLTNTWYVTLSQAL